MPRKRIRAILFGPQGSGKTTQGQLLAERFGVPFIEAGGALRDEIDEKTPMGKLVKEYVDAHVLAPDDLVNAIMIKRMKAAADTGFIIDGYPRNVEQAASLDKLAKIQIAIQLKLNDEPAIRRLANRLQCRSCRTVLSAREGWSKGEACPVCEDKLKPREEDEEATARRRIALYHFVTEPMASYYRQRGLLLAVNADQKIEELFEELTKKMGKLGFPC